MDRDWSSLTSEYEGLGYEVTNGVNSWTLIYYENGVNQNDGYLRASYLKKDGVLESINAYRYSPLEEFTNIRQLEITRISSGKLLWLLWFLLVIPVGGLIAFVIIRHKRKNEEISSEIV